ncbi:major facilitator superfamily domain-containing protein [Dendryphion nanum]|uniref:Major facilitator superfamily domain-containing protein n=1 Tax=Dendryphion nanum TaxID=256645 RepID=A0A9P9DB16_9PLEO|nr:major facilitator superfamily domain-containing protein [Dendryphion nanum]
MSVAEYIQGSKIHKDFPQHPSSEDVKAGYANQCATENEHARLQRLLHEYGATWTSSTDPNDPYNWPTYRKVLIGIIFSMGQLIAIMSASMIAAALPSISHDLNISASTAQITLLSYFLGMAFAPFLIAGCSEMWGRKTVWTVCTAWYVLWNALCPVGNNTGLMIVGRVMTGAGASVGTTLNGPIMADMFTDKNRGKSMAIVTLFPYLGPALGPIVGGLVTQWIHWSWIFWIMSIVEAVILLLGVVFIRESYTPVLLRRKALPQAGISCGLYIGKDIRSHLMRHLKRPVLLLIHRPIIWIISLEGVVTFAVYAFMLSTYATLWIERYGQSELASSLHYIAIMIGTSMSSQLGGYIMDWIYKKMSQRTGGQGVPEYRLPFVTVGVAIMPIGLLWYGWSAQNKLPWILVDVGVVIFSLGNFVAAQGVNAYQLDEFAEYGASANAATRLVTYILAFVFPIFAPQLYASLGYGWGNSLLALITVVLGAPTCALLWIWGARLRILGKRHI